MLIVYITPHKEVTTQNDMGDIRTNKIGVDIVILHQTYFVPLSWCPYVPEGRVLKDYMLRY